MRVNPPRVPLHPIFDTDKNMDLFMTYRDLKIKWKRTTSPRKLRYKLARKWRSCKQFYPLPKPTCSFIMHNKMPHKKKQPEFPPPGKLDLAESFVVFKTNAIHQHKASVGDIVQIERLQRREAGEQITFGTVLLVGSKDFTIIGKPTIPYAKVKCTIEQVTLAREQIVFKYKKLRRSSKFLRHRQYIMMLRVDEIIVDPALQPDGAPPKPLRLLDLWANRWLTAEELSGVQVKEDGITPVAADIYDGSEQQPNFYHRTGLTDCYRFLPDPQAPERVRP